MLADAIFHETTIAGLEFYANNGHQEFHETIPFLGLFQTAWNIMNVKSKSVGERKKDKRRVPIDSE
jgi:hypothetical protein